MLYGYPNGEGVIQATLETAGAMSAGYIPIDSHDKIGWRYIDGEFLPPLPTPIPPVTSVTRRQFKQGLTRIGLRAAVEAAIAAADQDTKDWYVVKDGVLSRFSGAGVTPIVPVVGRRVAYQRIADAVFWTDGVASGVLRGATNHPAGVELPQSPAISLTGGAFRPGACILLQRINLYSGIHLHRKHKRP